MDPQPDSGVVVIVDGNFDHWTKHFDKGSPGPLVLTVTYPWSYGVWVCREIHDTCPELTITTKQAPVPAPQPLPQQQPQPPGISLPLIPRLPDLALGGTRR